MGDVMLFFVRKRFEFGKAQIWLPLLRFFITLKVGLYFRNRPFAQKEVWGHRIEGYSVARIAISVILTERNKRKSSIFYASFKTVKGNYYKTEPWNWDIVTDSIASQYLRLRHKLIPYIW